MAFGYTLMKGRQGAAGHIRENGDQREIAVRGLPPETLCAMYALADGNARLCSQRQTDREGQARFSIAEPGHVFVALDGKPMLWEGGEETYLRAAAWLEKQRKTESDARREAAQSQDVSLPDTDIIRQVQQEARDDSIEQDEPTQKQAAMERPSDALLAEEAVLRDALQPAQEKAESAYPFERQPFIQPETENPPEQAYILRPAGEGEPVDALPKRSRF